MQRIRLIYRLATEIIDSKEDGLLILSDASKHRQIAIPCPTDKIGWFGTWRRDDPQRERFLPDVLVRILSQNGVDLQIDIDRLSHGRFNAILMNTNTFEQYPIDIIDAIRLTRISGGEIPLLMDVNLFMRYSTPYNDKTSGVALPINTITDSMLRKALDNAIKAENYEMASRISEEMKDRHMDISSSSSDEGGNAAGSEDSSGIATDSPGQ